MSLFGINIAGLVNQAMGSGVLPATLRRVIEQSRGLDPTAGRAPVNVDYPCRGFVQDYSEREVDESLIKQGDRRVLLLGASLPANVYPDSNDIVLIENDEYHIMAVTRDPASATWVCQGRRTSATTMAAYTNPGLFGVNIASVLNQAMGGGLFSTGLTKVVAGTRNPADPTAGVPSVYTTYIGRGFVEMYAERDIMESLVEQGDRKIILLGASLSAVPQTNDKLLIEGDEFRILRVTRDPAAATYTCQARRLTSDEDFEQLDWGFITDVASTSEDYQFVYEGVTLTDDYGTVP